MAARSVRGRPRIDGLVEEGDAGAFGVEELGVMLGFAWIVWIVWIVWIFACGLMVNFAGEHFSSSSVDHLRLGLQSFPQSECDVAFGAVGKMLHSDDALVQDWDLVVGLCARHAVRAEAFA